MKFFSGFSLKNESYLFESLLSESDYTLSGFSYGAIKAFRATQVALEEGRRIDRLQLLSPAFFQTKEEKFKRLQLLSYKKSKERYMTQFLSACFAPYPPVELEQYETESEELEDLLSYEWSLEALRDIVDRGVKLEVYLGSEDKIIDVAAARELFLEVATVTYINGANHFLQTK